MKKICLIQVWFGKLPDYFKFHLQTCNNQKNIDFLFFTDQSEDSIFQNAASNIKIKYLNPEIYKQFIFKKLGFKIELTNFYKLCDHKIIYADIFSDYLLNYDYVGFYDIDILWGDIYNLLEPHLNQEFISIGDKVYFPGIRGPFCIWKNNLIFNTFYKNINDYKLLLQHSKYQSLDETYLVKILEQNNISICDLGHLINVGSNGKHLDCSIVKNNKLYINNKEKLLIHFIYKHDLKICKTEDGLRTYYSKILKDDFYWVTYFDKNYEQFAKEMLNSLRMFSNRKVIIYSIDYKVDVVKDLDLDEDQFISINFAFDAKNNVEIIKNIKSYILKDSCERFADKKMVYIDADLFLTVNCDSVTKYFNQLDNYPLFNLNLYDYIVVNNYQNSGQSISPIAILGKKIGVENYLFPRRKANFIVYDNRSLPFFNEAVELYEKYKNTEFGIFAIYDEDADNILLAKYNYINSLPTVDIEETDDINNLDIFSNYGYGKNIESSINKKLPEHVNDILCFHKMKTAKEFEDIKNKYLNQIIVQNEIICYYTTRKKSLIFHKKGFFNSKTFNQLVYFEVFDNENNQVFLTLDNQNIYDYQLYYIDFIEESLLTSKDFSVRIIEKQTGKIIYNNLLKFLG